MARLTKPHARAVAGIGLATLLGMSSGVVNATQSGLNQIGVVKPFPSASNDSKSARKPEAFRASTASARVVGPASSEAAQTPWAPVVAKPLPSARLDATPQAPSYGTQVAANSAGPALPSTSMVANTGASLQDRLKVAQLQRRRPGYPEPQPYQLPSQPEPNSQTGLQRTEPPPPRTGPDEFIPVPDRWRLINDLGLVKEKWWDPYNRNILKGDRPFYKDWFFSLGLISDSIFEPREIPTPVGLQAGQAPALGIFGDPEQLTLNQNIIIAGILFKGDTVFRPPDYEFRFTPVINYNYTKAHEIRALNIDPGRGTHRHDYHIGLQELFFDYHIRNVSDRYDFDSIRIGIQPFSTDFRGFLFQDLQLGIRLFGNRDNNLWQYNLAWFRKLEKDTNSGLNDVAKDVRDDDTFIFNLYRQDWPALGFTTQGTIVHNRNREDEENFFDRNGFIQRPASLGFERRRRYKVTYLGLNGDGHFGRLNLTYSAYYAMGSESRGTFTTRPQDIRAYFGAAEASVDFDWIRARFSALHASGDKNPFDGKSTGFDAIFENPVFAGADTSFWIRQGIPLVGGGGVTLSTRNGVLNNLRSSKEHGQSNFSNPGVTLLGVGADMDILPELRLSTNVNHIWFANTAVVEVARNQGPIEPSIGTDISAAFIYRPYFHQNIVFRLSGSVLVPGEGYKQLFPDSIPYSVLGNLVLTY